jgi:hypothetical protein
MKRKNHSEAAKPRKSTIRRQNEYIDSNTHIPDAAIVSRTLTRNPTWTPPNQVSYLKESSMDSFTLGLLPKIDFTWTIEHTLATAWELVNLRFSLNILSKLREFNTKFCTIYKPRAPYL